MSVIAIALRPGPLTCRVGISGTSHGSLMARKGGESLRVGRASPATEKTHPMSPVSELNEGARRALRQLLDIAPTDDLEEAVIPCELEEIRSEPEGSRDSTQVIPPSSSA